MPDLNLLITLDVLLAEGSVVGAAKRLRLSPSAMSRALARLRETTGDPLLVRAGRGLVPTPRALQLREQVSQLVQDAHAVLRPLQSLDLASVERTFTLRTSEVRNTCWFEMRERSEPSPTPWRVRKNCSACLPIRVWLPAGRSKNVYWSLIGLVKQTSTPPMAFDISITPLKSIIAK